MNGTEYDDGSSKDSRFPFPSSSEGELINYAGLTSPPKSSWSGLVSMTKAQGALSAIISAFIR